MNKLLSLFFEKKISFSSKQNLLFLLIILGIIFVISPSFLTLQWVGLYLAMFSTMSNDSIQTIGTFLSSNSKVKWWKMWLYIGSLFVITIFSGWLYFDHSIDFQRLHDIPYTSDFNIMYILAPILLIFLTYHKISVSTTFLILSVFSTQNTITYMLLKTFFGYFIAFFISFFIWLFLLKFFEKKFNDFSEKKIKKWTIFQWVSSGFLWISWLTQNTSNIVVYIPRKLDLYSLVLFIVLGLVMIGFTIYNKGGPIQEIVNEKTDITNIKATTIINFTFAVIIIVMNQIGKIPMATTWIFIGILGGRELGLIKYKKTNLSLKKDFLRAQKTILKDLIHACFGIAISLIFYMINSTFKF